MAHRTESLDRDDVTELLSAWSEGDADAFERVMPLVYNELHHMAAPVPGRRALRYQPPGDRTRE